MKPPFCNLAPKNHIIINLEYLMKEQFQGCHCQCPTCFSRIPHVIIYILWFFVPGRFLNVVAQWPGSTHDSFVFQASNLQQFLEEGNNDSSALASLNPLRALAKICKRDVIGSGSQSINHITDFNVILN